MKGALLGFGFLLQYFAITQSLIIPDEVPSLLSVIYSNIPTVKKGTDSRLGWGFRLGDRADFQVLVELGPQTNTQPLANQGDEAGNSKRNVPNTLRDVLYAYRQRDNKEKQISNTNGGKWLEQWSENVRNSQKNANLPVEPRPELGIGEIDAKSVIPDDAALALEELYGKKKENNSKKDGQIEISTRKPETTTSSKEALDNVDLDDE